MAVVLPWTALGVLRDLAFLRAFQIEEYSRGRFLHWWIMRLWPTSGDVILGVTALTIGSATVSSGVGQEFIVLAWVATGLVMLFRDRPPSTPRKKPLVMTRRAVVLFASSALLRSLVVAGTIADAFTAGDPGALPVVGGVVGMSAVVSPLVLIVADVASSPWMAWVRRRNVAKALTVLTTWNPTVIGVTGSYGKTTTKEFAASILRSGYPTASTPKSYNTILGVASWLTSTEGQLRDRYLVAEMAAYRSGEIRRLCELLRPTIGVVMSVGPQHLERFGSVANVAAAKYELVEALPPHGLAIFNADDGICYQLHQRTKHVPTALFGWRDHLEEVAVSATGVRSTPGGLRFVLTDRASARSADCEVAVLGAHNVSNILAAALVGLRCELSFDKVVAAIREIAPVPHRLELRHGAAATTILDDSYNSNPVGAREALGVLAQFPSGSRILVTPGLTELGARETEENRALGRLAAAACDAAIVIGDRGAAIRAGLLETGFDRDRIVLAPSLRRATEALPAMAGSGATILFLNDLPDTYESEVRASLFGD